MAWKTCCTLTPEAWSLTSGAQINQVESNVLQLRHAFWETGNVTTDPSSEGQQTKSKL